MTEFGRVCMDAIFGTKKTLRPGEDDDKLLALLENDDSEFEGFSDANDDSEDELIPPVNFEENQEAIEDDSDDSGEDSDPEFNIPLSVLQSRYVNKKKWEKSDSFSPQDVEVDDLPDTTIDRRDWGISDYISMYLKDSDFENMTLCTNLKYLIDHDKALRLSTEEMKQFTGVTVLISCLRYPRIKMFWAKTTRVESIAKSMTRDRFFSIRSHLKL